MKPAIVFFSVLLSGALVGLFAIVTIGGGHGTNEVFYFTFPLAALTYVTELDHVFLFPFMILQTIVYATGLTIFQMAGKLVRGIFLFIALHLSLYSIILITKPL